MRFNPKQQKPVEAFQLKRALNLDGNGAKGDYIVIHEDGEIEVVNKNEFEATYELPAPKSETKNPGLLTEAGYRKRMRGAKTTPMTPENEKVVPMTPDGSTTAPTPSAPWIDPIKPKVIWESVPQTSSAGNPDPNPTVTTGVITEPK